MKSGKKTISTFEIDDSLWLNMEELDWSCITDGLTPKHYGLREELFHQAKNFQYVYICRSGRIQLDILGANGNRRVLFICSKNSIFGELSLFDKLPYNCTATAVTDSYVYAVPASHFLKQLDLCPDLALNLLKVQSTKIRLLTTVIKQMSFNDATYRVAYVLANLIQDYSRQVNNTSYKLTLKYTHQDVADLTGLSRVSVSNIISRFQTMGILKKDPIDGYITIRAPEKLYEFLNDFE